MSCNPPDNVIDKSLYCKVKKKVKEQVKVWPSAYASGQLVQEYKRQGGKYKGSKKEKESSDLDRWYKEKWVNVCEKTKKGEYKPCGRKKSTKKKDYPYCRPSKRINSQTPMTVSEFKKKYGKKKLESMCEKKQKEGKPKKGRPSRIRPDK